MKITGAASVEEWRERYEATFEESPDKRFPNASALLLKNIVTMAGALHRQVEVALKESIKWTLSSPWWEFNFSSKHLDVGRPFYVPSQGLLSRINLLPPALFRKTFYLPQLAVTHRLDELFARVIRECAPFDPECLVAAHLAVEEGNLDYLEKLAPFFVNRRSTMVNKFSLVGRAAWIRVTSFRKEPKIIEFLAKTLPQEEPWRWDEKITLEYWLLGSGRVDIKGMVIAQPKSEVEREHDTCEKGRLIIEKKQREKEEAQKLLDKLHQVDVSVFPVGIAFPEHMNRCIKLMKKISRLNNEIAYLSS